MEPDLPPRLPAITGISFRRFRDDSDFEHIASIINRCKQIDGVERSATAERLGHFYRHSPGWNQNSDIVFIDVGDATVGYSACIWQAPGDDAQTFFHTGFVLPEWRRLGLGTALLQSSERRQREVAASQPATVERWHESFAADSEQAKTALLLRQGYAPVRYNYRMLCSLEAPIEAPPLPVDLRLRRIEPNQYHAILDASNEAFRDHWGNMTTSWEEFEGWATLPDTDMTLWRVAWDGNEVAGMAFGEIPRAENVEYKRMRGYISNVCVRQPWRGRGLARALIGRVLHDFRSRAYTEAVLDVDTENSNGALRLYESLGFTPIKTTLTYQKKLKLDA